jgi:hypothetical protein
MASHNSGKPITQPGAWELSALAFVPASSSFANHDGDPSPCGAINLRTVSLERLVTPLCLGADLLELGFRTQRGQAGDTVQCFSGTVILLDGAFQQPENWRRYHLSARQVYYGCSDEFWLWISVGHQLSLPLCSEIRSAG